MRRLLAAVVMAALVGACSTNDGRQLADPDPDLTRVTTTAPTATGEQARGAAAPDLAIPVSSAGPSGLTVASPDFAPGGSLPTTVTCDGAGTAPTVTWSGAPDDARLALAVRDADGGGAVHWLVTGLSGSSGTVDPSALTVADERTNSFGTDGWTGPCPDDGLEHRYVFALYLVPADPAVPDDAPPEAVLGALEAEQTGAATTLGKYLRS
ncbi:MAG: YbhB/YbcL family Raf kinase inhibitor-like protein [Actinomycetota bacterium]